MVTSATHAPPRGPAPAILATFDLPREVAPGEQLVLAPLGEAARLRIEAADERRALDPLPLTVDLLPLADASAFGAEERCRVDRPAGSIVIHCQPGAAPAGALVLFAARYPAGARAEGRLAASGGEGFAAQLVRAGSDAAGAVPIERQTALPLPRDGPGPAQLVLLAPPAGGRLELSRLSIEPLSPPPQTSAAGWAWEPDLWRHRGAELIDAAAARGIDRLYVTLAIDGGRVRHRAQLLDFLRAAQARGIKVEAVEGDPDMVTPAGLRSAVARAEAIARFDRSLPAALRLAGVQYDLEPYTLRTWGVYPADHRGWAEAIRALAAAAGRPLHLVLPFWIAEDEGGRQFLREVAPIVSGVTAMAYRSDPAAIAAIAEPLLAWGVAAGKPVRIALETGPVAAEGEERFRHAATGRLAVRKWEGRTQALLLAGEGRIEGAQMFASLGPVTVEPARISFLGDEAAMMRAARGLQPAFGAWSSFAGMAYHGIGWLPAAPAPGPTPGAAPLAARKN